MAQLRECYLFDPFVHNGDVEHASGFMAASVTALDELSNSVLWKFAPEWKKNLQVREGGYFLQHPCGSLPQLLHVSLLSLLDVPDKLPMLSIGQLFHHNSENPVKVIFIVMTFNVLINRPTR